MTESEHYQTIEEVAEGLQVSDQTVRRWIKDGRLPAYKPGREWRIRTKDLENFLEARSSPKAPSSSSTAPEAQTSEEQNSTANVWRGEYLARVDEALTKWEDELEEKLPLAEDDYGGFLAWIDEVRELGRPLVMGVVSGYMATTKNSLEATALAHPYLASWDELWRRIEEPLHQGVVAFSEDEEKRFQETREKARVDL